MPRPSMSPLIATVAGLVYDPDNAIFNPDAVQAILDRHRQRVIYLELRSRAVQTGGGYAWLTYEAPRGDWETDAVLVDGAYAPLTPATSDYAGGIWTFAASQPPPVLVTGQTYDVYAAAADLCIQRAAFTSDQYLMKDNNQFLNRQQVPVNWRTLAADYRAMRRVWMG